MKCILYLKPFPLETTYFYNVLRDYYLNTRWQSSWKINALKMFRKLQDCFEIFLKWNVIFNAFPVFIYHNFTVLLSLYVSIHQCIGSSSPILRDQFWETLVTERQIYSGHSVLSNGQKHSCWLSGTQKPLYHMTFYPPKWKLRAR